MKRDTLSVKQIEYKNAELVLCEFMALQDYDEEEWKPPQYKDFNLQELHDFIADKIEALDNRTFCYQWKRGKYKWQQSSIQN